MAVTLKDVARLAGTSQASVSAVLNQGGGKNTRVGAVTREKILAAASKLGYVANPIARSLVTGRTGVLGLMLPYESSFLYPDPWATMVINGLVAEVVRRKYNLMLYTAVHGHWRDDAASTAVDLRVDGVIVVLPLGNADLYDTCARLSMPVVSVLKNPRDEEDLVVNSNDYEGARLAVQHLIDLGHRRIALIKGWEEVPTMPGRIQGYLDTLAANGIDPDPRFIVQGDFNRWDGRLATEEILRIEGERPTAIFCCNDLSAHGAIEALRENGLRVPEDMSVVGYDDTPYSSMMTPPLTSVNMLADQLGARAASMLIDRIEGKEIEDNHPLLPVSLTIRSSTCPPPSAR